MSKVNLNVYVFSDLEPLPLFFYESGRSHLLLGKAYFFEENYDEAGNEFKQAIFSAKNIEVLDGLTEAAANFFLGWVELKRNNFPETLSFFKKATELKPYNFGYVKELASGYLLNHNYILAKEKCKETLALNPDDENAKELFIMIQDNEEAVE